MHVNAQITYLNQVYSFKGFTISQKAGLSVQWNSYFAAHNIMTHVQNCWRQTVRNSCNYVELICINVTAVEMVNSVNRVTIVTDYRVGWPEKRRSFWATLSLSFCKRSVILPFNEPTLGSVPVAHFRLIALLWTAIREEWENYSQLFYQTIHLSWNGMVLFVSIHYIFIS